MAAPNDTVSQRFALVDNEALNSEQQEFYNFQKATGLLAGYAVYRFGAAELQGHGAGKVVRDFFKTLFKRYLVISG